MLNRQHWCLGQDSNLRQFFFVREAVSTTHTTQAKLVLPVGLEPTSSTYGISLRRRTRYGSINWGRWPESNRRHPTTLAGLGNRRDTAANWSTRRESNSHIPVTVNSLRRRGRYECMVEPVGLEPTLGWCSQRESNPRLLVKSQMLDLRAIRAQNLLPIGYCHFSLFFLELLALVNTRQTQRYLQAPNRRHRFQHSTLQNNQFAPYSMSSCMS